MKTNKKRNLKKAGFVAGVLCLASIGGVSAYLTDFDKADNQFTVGKVSIDLDEPGFKPEEQTKIEPGKDVKKDPQIKNTGVNDAFVYLEVSIPMAEVEAASEDGTRLGKREQELFSFQTPTNWTKLSSKKTGDNQVYVYAYNEVLKPEQTTNTLFDSVSAALCSRFYSLHCRSLVSEAFCNVQVLRIHLVVVLCVSNSRLE